MSKKADNRTPWVKKVVNKKPGFNIASIMRSKEVKGDIGLEIEVEGSGFPKTECEGYPSVRPELIPKMWGYHRDGSLRGEDNAEYVLKKPLKFDEVPDAIAQLWEMFSNFGSVLADSNRTSVHVHLNAQKWHLNRVCAFSALYFCLEELLTEFCGDHRVGNLFCLRAKDAPAIVSKLKNFIVNDGNASLSDGLHYAGLNVQALCKFGSIEIRSLRGCTDPQTILDWVAILERLYKVSGEYPDPRLICEGFSGEGPMAFLYRILGAKAYTVTQAVSWDTQRIMDSLYEGIRLAQDLCYCREWSEYEPLDTSPDPFDRDLKKIGISTYQTDIDVYLDVMTATSLSQAAPAVIGSGSTWQTTPLSTASPTPPDIDTPYVPEPDSDGDDDWFVPELEEYDEI